jgi:hypothetical protein
MFRASKGTKDISGVENLKDAEAFCEGTQG